MPESVANRGVINFNLEKQADTEVIGSPLLSMDYEFIGYGEILVANNACTFGAELIEAAEQQAVWAKSTVARHQGGGYLDDKHRSSTSVPLDSPGLDHFGRKLEILSRAALQLYTMRNTFVQSVRTSPFELLRYAPGQQFGLHIDVISGYSPQRSVSILVYLNDDYEGGEIQFPRQGIAYKPRRGSMLLFPSNFVYPHTSSPIVRGTKYAAVAWFLN